MQRYKNLTKKKHLSQNAVKKYSPPKCWEKLGGGKKRKIRKHDIPATGNQNRESNIGIQQP